METLIKVKFAQDYDMAFPHAYIKKGETGTITNLSDWELDGFISIKLDKEHDGLDEWDNHLNVGWEIIEDHYQGSDEVFLANALEIISN